MPKRHVLTERSVQSLKATGERYEVADSSFATGSFTVRVGADGTKVFCLRYRPRDSKRQRRALLGVWPTVSLADARQAARKMMATVALGGDPEAERRTKRSATCTFGDLVQLYLAEAKLRKRSWRGDQYLIDHDLLPRWKTRPLDEITRADVLLTLRGIEERGARVTANRTGALVHRLFAWAQDNELVETNPATRLRRAKERPRERWISDHDELRRLWAAFEAEGGVVEAVFKLRLLTGQRGVEIRSMRWADLDLGGAMWTVPWEVSKNGKAHRVPLSRQAAAVIEAMRAYSGDDLYVFPAQRGAAGPIGTLNKAYERIKAASGVDFTPHDLRRTVASHMAHMGVGIDIIGKVLNHTARGVTAAVYIRATYDDAKRVALQRWADRLDAILRNDASNIVAWPMAAQGGGDYGEA